MPSDFYLSKLALHGHCEQSLVIATHLNNCKPSEFSIKFSASSFSSVFLWLFNLPINYYYIMIDQPRHTVARVTRHESGSQIQDLGVTFTVIRIEQKMLKSMRAYPARYNKTKIKIKIYILINRFTNKKLVSSEFYFKIIYKPSMINSECPVTMTTNDITENLHLWNLK